MDDVPFALLPYASPIGPWTAVTASSSSNGLAKKELPP
jgi:hypothetical protein